MHILFFAEHFPPEIGGVAASAQRIARALSRLGHEVDVFALTRELPSGAVESLEVEGLTIHRFGRARNPDFTLQLAQNFLEWLHAKTGFELLWGHYVETAGFLAAWLGKLWSRPSILALRGNDLDRQLYPPGDLSRLEWSLRNCTQILAVSEDLARKARAFAGRDCVVLPNSVDSDTFRPAPLDEALQARYELGPESLILGFSGELRAKKGLDFLIEALRTLSASRPTRLLIIGDVRAKARALLTRALAPSPQLEQAIIVTGHLGEPREVARHLRLLDMLLHPSLWDGMPNSVLEAMATGVPVIASDAGGVPEIIRDEENGILLPKTHLHQLAHRVEEWLALPGYRKKAIVEAARATIVEDFSMAAEESRLEQLLRSF